MNEPSTQESSDPTEQVQAELVPTELVQTELLPPLVQGVLRLFDEELSELRFGGIDRDRLLEAAQEVAEARARLERRREQAELARQQHEQELSELSRLSRQALAYARIHAEGDERLAERLSLLAAPAKAPKKRKRRKKTVAEARTELPFDGAEPSPSGPNVSAAAG